MFDIGWTELLVIGIVALIVVGPKDLPVMFRTLGRFTAKARSMAREFQRAMDEAADDAGVKDVSKDLRSMTSNKNLGLDKLKDAADRFEKWEPQAPKPKGPSKVGTETQKLADERAEAARKIREDAARRAAERHEAAAARATEAADAEAAADVAPQAPAEPAEAAEPVDVKAAAGAGKARE